MPSQWTPIVEAFVDGASLGIFAGFAMIALLLVVSTVRRLMQV